MFFSDINSEGHNSKMGSGASKAAEREAELKRKSVVIIGGGYGGAVVEYFLSSFLIRSGRMEV